MRSVPLRPGELVSFDGTDTREGEATFYGIVESDDVVLSISGTRVKTYVVRFIGEAEETYSAKFGVFLCSSLTAVERVNDR